MLPLLSLLRKSKSDTFFGATFDTGHLTLILFKDAYPLCSTQEHLTSGMVVDGRVVDKEHFTQSLKVCAERCISQQPNENPGTIFFGVGGGNCVGSLIAARQKRDIPIKITKKLLTQIYKEIEINGLDSALEELYEVTGNDSADLEIVLTETVSIKLDGTISYNPIDQNSSLFEIEVYNAYCPSVFIDLLEDVAKGAKLKLGGAFPLQYLLSKKLRRKFNDIYDATLVTVHTDYTDISVIFGGKPVKSKTLPLGANDIEKDVDFWMDGFELAFSEFSGIKTFASNVYICGLGLEKTEFWEMLEWREWEEKIPFRTKPVFTKLDANILDLPHDYKGDLLNCGLLNICKELG